MSTPILPFAVWASGTNQNSIPANDNALRGEILQRNVNNATTAQPGSPADGDTYIIQSTHTGAQWSTFTPKDVAIYKGGSWYAFAPVEGVRVSVSGVSYIYTSGAWTAAGGGGGGVSDGDKGDITVSSSGAVWTVDNTAITYAKMQNISAQFRLLGRNSASAGVTEEVTFSQLLDWVGSAANGDILYRNAGAWTRLPIGTNGHVLTLASGLPSWAAAAGGGGLTNFTDAISTSSPNTVIPVASLTATNAATNVDFAVRPKGTGALTAQVADSSTTGGNKRAAYAVDWQMLRAAATQVASGTNSVIGGGENNTAKGADNTIAGGTTNTTDGVTAFIGGGTTNTIAASSSYCVIAGGNTNSGANIGSAILGGGSNTCSANFTAILGGQSNNASASGAAVAGGHSNTSSGVDSLAAGFTCTADGSYSFAHGTRATTRGVQGMDAQSSGQFAALGDSQSSRLVLRVSTTNATTTAATSDAAAAATTNTSLLVNSSAFLFKAMVVGRQNTTGDAAAFEITGLIKRGANAAATALVGTPTVTAIAADAGASTWTAVAAANTTNGTLEIRVTGEAAKTIRWTAVVETTEVAG